MSVPHSEIEPESSCLSSKRSTLICTIRPGGGYFKTNGKPLLDARVLSLGEVGMEALKTFVQYSGEVISATHRKVHSVFLRAEDKLYTKIDLCDFFAFCKCSTMEDTRVLHEDGVYLGCIETPFGSAFVSVQPLCNGNKCDVKILEGNNTIQIQIKRKKAFKGDIIFGVGLYTLERCTRCSKANSETVKLRVCNRCLAFDGIKLFYCSRDCQLQDYPRHRHVCTYDWHASDWRENAPKLVKK